MNQYLVQNYNQIIDLFDNMDVKSSIKVDFRADSPIAYILLTKAQLDAGNFAAMNMTTTAHFSKVVQAPLRFMVVKSSQGPVVITITRTPQAATTEFFTLALTDPTYFWAVMILVALLAILVVFLLMKYLKSRDVVVRSSRQAFDASTGSPYDRARAVGNNWNEVRGQLKDLYNRG
jgi:hypothetical protein